MIVTTELRELDVSPERCDTQLSFISAGSGLVCVGSHFYVVGDDEHHLGVFSMRDNGPGELVRLFSGNLPIFKADRKRQKPDLEAIVFIPAFEGFSDGALAALGSASRPNRGRGVLLGLDPQGALSGSPEQVDMGRCLARFIRCSLISTSREQPWLAISCCYFSEATRNISKTRLSTIRCYLFSRLWEVRIALPLRHPPSREWLLV